MTRFVCAGDLHIGSGGDLSPGGPDQRLLEMEDVLRQIVDAANELECSLLWAGDAWERRRPTPAEILVVRRQFARLKRSPIVIAGNHDVEAFERPTGYDLIGARHREGLHDYGSPGEPIVVTKPDIVIAPNNYSIACLPWASPAKLVAIDDGVDRDDLNATLAAGLLEIARGLFARMDPWLPRILLGHWSISGASTPAGIPTDQFREPVLPLAELAAIGFDAVVFGHIHKPQLLTLHGPPIFYVGSPLPLNFGEPGDHCCWMLDVGPNGAAAMRIDLESPQLLTIDGEVFDPADGSSVVQVHYPVDGIEGATVKLRVEATEAEARRLDLAVVKRDLLELGARHVWSIQVDVQRVRTTSSGPAVDESLDDLQAFELWLDLQIRDATLGLPTDAIESWVELVCARHAGYVERAAG